MALSFQELMKGKTTTSTSNSTKPKEKEGSSSSPKNEYSIEKILAEAAGASTPETQPVVQPTIPAAEISNTYTQQANAENTAEQQQADAARAEGFRKRAFDTRDKINELHRQNTGDYSEETQKIMAQIASAEKQYEFFASEYERLTGKKLVDNFWERAGNTTGGGLKTAVGDTANAVATAGMWGQQKMAEADPNSMAAVAATMLPETNLAHYGINRTEEEQSKAIQNWGDKVYNEGQEQIQDAKYGLGAAGQFAVDAGAELTKIGADAAFSLVAPWAGTANMVTRSFGGGAREARADGKDIDAQMALGLAQAGKEYVLNKTLGGMTKAYGQSKLGNAASKALERAVKNDTARAVLQRVLNTEGLEEGLSTILDPAIKAAVYDDLSLVDAYSELELEDVLYSAIMGQALGFIGGGEEPSRFQNNPPSTSIDTAAGTQAETAKPGTAPQSEKTPLDILMEVAEENALNAPTPQGDIQTPPTTTETSAAQSDELNLQDTGNVRADMPAPPAEAPTTPRSKTAEEYDAETEELLEMLPAKGEPPASNRVKPNNDIDPVEIMTGIPATANQEMQQQSAPQIQQDTNSQAEIPQTTNTPTQQTAPAGSQMVERGFTKNVSETSTTNENLAKDLAANKELYEQLSNKDTLGKAKAIYSQGFEEARRQLYEALGLSKGADGKKFPPEMVPLSRMVANELAIQGKVDEAHRLIADVAAELTSAGQLGQAGAILKNTDPATARQTIEKHLDAINKKIEKKYGNRYTWRAELTQAEIDQINKTDFTQEGAFEAIYDQIGARLGEDMPSTLGEKIHELRRINMLLRPRTMIKNTVGNVPMAALRKGAEKLSGAIQDRMVKKGTLDAIDQTRTAKVTAESRTMAKELYEQVKDEISGKSNKWDMNNILRENRTVFKPLKEGKDTATLEVLRKKTYEYLEKGDAPFVKSAFVDSLAEYCSAHGITDIDNVPQAAIDFATQNAMEATFKATNALAKALNDIKNQGGAAGAALDILFPFTTTPLNITKQMLDYSPVGLFNAALTAYNKGSKADIADKIGKGTVGSLAMAVGFALGSLGAISAGEDEDKDKAAFDKATGKGKYSLQGEWLAQVLPDGAAKDWLESRSFSYDWAQPAGSLVALGAEIAEAFAQDESWGSAAFNAFYSAGDSVLNMSVFQNIVSILKGSGKPTQQILDAIIEGGVSQLMPGLLGDIAKIIDGTVRTTYTGGNVLQDSAAKIASSIPGLSFVLPESVSASGKAVTRGGLAERTFNALANPATVTIGEKDAATDAITALYEATGDKTIFPRVSPYKVDYAGGYTLTGEERETFQKTQAEVYYKELNSMIDSGEWKNLSSEAQIKVLQRLNEFALDSAKRELVTSRGDSYTSDNDSISKLSDPGEFISAKAIYDADVKAGNYSGIDAMLDVYNRYQPATREMLEEKIPEIKNLLKVKDVVDAESYFDVAKRRSAIYDATGSNGTKTKLTAIGKANLTEKEEEAMVGLLLGKEGQAAYHAFTDTGYSWEDAAKFLGLTGSNKDGTANKKEQKAYVRETFGTDWDEIWKILYPKG